METLDSDPPATATNDFGALLRQMRVRSGMSQNDAALKGGLKPPYLCAVERGKRPAPEEPVVIRLAEALSLSHEDTRALVKEAARSRGNWNASKPRPHSTDSEPGTTRVYASLCRVIRQAELMVVRSRVTVTIRDAAMCITVEPPHELLDQICSTSKQPSDALTSSPCE